MIEAFYEGCSEDRRKKCRAKNGPWLDLACRHCPRNQPPDPRVAYLADLNRLVEAGYPWGQDDLDLETWRDLGTLRSWLASRRMF